MVEKISYSVTHDQEMIDRFEQCTDTGAKGLTVFVFGTIVVLFMGFAGLVLLADGYYGSQMETDAARLHGGLGLLVGFFGCIAIGLLASRRQGQVIKETLDRLGPMQVTIDEYGIVTKSFHADATYRWGAIRGVSSLETGIGINIFGTSFIALPNECLPEGLGHDDVVAQINAWRTA